MNEKTLAKNNQSQRNVKALPRNNEAEQAVLGGVLLEGTAIDRALEVLSPDGTDFYHPAHRALFRGMNSLYEKHTPIDPVTLAALFKNNSEVLDGVGGISYIGELLEATPTAANITYYAKIVRELAIKRGLITKATELLDTLYTGNTGVEEIVDKAQHDFLTVSVTQAKPYEHIAAIATEVFQELKHLHENNGGLALTGLPTGFMELNSLLGGLQKTDLIIIAGRPSMGKSALCMQMAGDLAILNYKVGIFPVEVGKKQLVRNILACQGKINTHNFRDGRISDMGRLERTVRAITSTNIFIDESSRSSTEIVRQARRMRRDHGLDIAFIDHLSLMRESVYFENRNAEVDFMVNNLKSMGKELNIPVVLLCQLNREVEKRNPPEPRLSDLRESGAIEQTADIVVFPYRPEYYDKDSEDKGKAKIIVAKHRNGAIGEFWLRWNRHYLRFENMCDGQEEMDLEDDNIDVPF